MSQSLGPINPPATVTRSGAGCLAFLAFCLGVAFALILVSFS